MTALRIEGGSVSATVSRELAALMQSASFFARGEVNGWLEHVHDEGLIIESMSDVPDDLIRLLAHGWYLKPSYSADIVDRETGDQR